MVRGRGPGRLRLLNGDGDGLPGDDELELMRLERAAVHRFHAQNAVFERSAVGLADIGRGTLQGSVAGVVVARSLACDEVRTAVLVAPVVRGEVHTWLDIRSAIAIGFGMALGQLLFRLVRRPWRR